MTEQTYYRWHNEYVGLNVAQAKRLKQLEDENGPLKKLVGDLSLEKAGSQGYRAGKIVSLERRREAVEAADRSMG